MRPALLTPLLIAASLFMAGCDQLGIESASVLAARREADGKAVGGACRHAGRAIEDCYVLNRRADKASVYAGWREMDDYMRENKLEPVAPQIQSETQVAASQPAEAEDAAEETPPKPGDKSAEHTSADKADKPGETPPRRRRAAP